MIADEPTSALDEGARANQIIHVKSEKPVKGIGSMEAVWVEGTLSTGQSKTDMGASGYVLSLASVSAYVPPAR